LGRWSVVFKAVFYFFIRIDDYINNTKIRGHNTN